MEEARSGQIVTDKEYRDLLRKSHLCRYCKRQDAYTISGHALCAECAEKDRERQRKRRAKDGGKKNRDRVKALRDTWRAEGVCTYCGKRKPKAGMTLCDICAAKQRQRVHDRRVEKAVNWPRGANGYCWTCNKRKAMEGKKLCEACFNTAVENGKKGREKSRDGHSWKRRFIC